MKKVFLLLLAAMILAPAMGQIKKKLVTEPFNSIKAGGVSNIRLIKGDEHVVIIEAPEKVMDKIKVSVSDGRLSISYSNLKLKNHESLNFYITLPDIQSIDLSGAAELETVNAFTTDSFDLEASGATEIDMELDVKKLNAHVSGAADVTLTGKAVYENIIASGAADFDADELVADTVKVVASGASSVSVNVLHKIEYKESGVADIKIKGTPNMIIRNDSTTNPTVIHTSGNANTQIITGSDHYNGDTVKVKVGSLDVEVVDDDTVTIRIGGHQLRVDQYNGNIRFESVKKPRFNGHWGGVEMGINGYLTDDFNTQWGKEYDYLNLRYEKSWFINLNLWEQNIPFNKNKTIGMMTGIGLSWNNYRFSNSTYLESDSSTLKGYYMVSKAYFDPDSIFTNQDLVKKSKLTNMYVNVPVLFEFQTKNPNRNKRFHFTVGGVIGFRVLTHTKVYFNIPNEEYKLQDPATGDYSYYSFKTPNVTKRNIVKEHDGFHQSPVKFDARIGIGYSWLNLFATYSINGMFQENRGPKLHPWTIGLTLVGW